MRAVLDACVLYPTVMREVLIGCAGLYQPLWSERILEEWRRAAMKHPPGAGTEIAVLMERFPKAAVPAPEREDIVLPDPDDVHVLSAAIEGGADAIVTLNLGDFPTRVLARHGVLRMHPDAFLIDLHAASPDAVREAAHRVLEVARGLSGEDWAMRALLKKARLPRLGKALS